MLRSTITVVTGTVLGILTAFLSACLPTQSAEAASMNFTTPTVIWTDETIGVGEVWNVEPFMTLTIAPGVNITNMGTINNNGLFDIMDNATINNSGTINTLVTLINSGTVTNFGTINNFGDISNHDTMINKCGGTFNNDGRYFGNTEFVNESCYSLNLFEGATPSDFIFGLGQESTAVAETDDPIVTHVNFTWNGPSGTQGSELVPLVAGSADSTFAPNEPGAWIVIADFGNGQVIQKTLSVSFFVLPESPIGAIALILTSTGISGGYLYFRSRKPIPEI